MTGKLYFILGSSFVMGMLAGGYLYLTVFAPEYKSGITTSEAIDKDATVIAGRMYGACEESDSCSSFKLIENGSYSYLQSTDAELIKGKLKSSFTDPYFALVGSKTFFNDAKLISSQVCTFNKNGNNYAYDVTFNGETYALDTCGTAFANDMRLQSHFHTAWEAIIDPEKTYPTIIEKGVAGAVEEYMQNVGN